MSEAASLPAPDGRNRATRAPLISALVALALLLGATAAVTRWLQQRLISDERAAVTLRLAPYVNTLSVAVNRRLSRVTGLKAFVESSGSTVEILHEFPVLAAGLQEGATGVKAIQLLKNGVIVASYPAPTSPGVIGYDLSKDPRPVVVGDLARATGSGAMTITGPLAMRGGVLAIFAEQRINVKHPDFPNMAVVMLEVPAVFEVALMEHGIPGLDVSLLDRSGKIAGPANAVRPADPVTVSVAIPDGDWTLLAAPHRGWGAATRAMLNGLAVAGVLISLLLAAFTYLILAGRQGLTFAVAQRTAELEIANAELRHEVNEREAAQTVLRKHEESQLHRQKMEAIGTLAGGIAHDFNNILTAILGFGRLANEQLEEFGTTPPAADEMNRVRNDVVEMIHAAEHATVITNQLLSFSLKQMVKPEAIDAAEAVRGVGALLRGVLGERLEMVVESEPNLPMVNIDKSQLTQVLLNLALNARDAMPAGGTLKVAMRAVTVPALDRALPAGRYVELSVADSGVGMSPELQARAFEPFFTTKGLGKGTGLGLSTVYGIVTRAGGKVELETAEGLGTTVRVLLPECRAVPAIAELVPLAPVPAAAGETILVAEDESSIAELTSRILRRAGYTVLLAPSGEAALELYGAHPYTVDLLITDCVMPGISGVSLARALRARDATLPVLFMSGYTDQLADLHDFVGDHSAELAKPFAPDALVQCASDLLLGRAR